MLPITTVPAELESFPLKVAVVTPARAPAFVIPPTWRLREVSVPASPLRFAPEIAPVTSNVLPSWAGPRKRSWPDPDKLPVMLIEERDPVPAKVTEPETFK